MNKNEVNLQDIQEESREQDTSRLVDMSYTEEELAEQERATDTEGLDEDGTSIRVFHNRYVKIGLTAAAVAFAGVSGFVSGEYSKNGCGLPESLNICLSENSQSCFVDISVIFATTAVLLTIFSLITFTSFFIYS